MTDHCRQSLYLIALAGLVTFTMPAVTAAQSSCSGCITCLPEKATRGNGEDILALDNACATGECSSAIPCQGGDGPIKPQAAADELEKLLRSSDSSTVLTFVKANSSNIEYIPSRNAFAVFGCGRSLTALFPLNSNHLKLASIFPAPTGKAPEHAPAQSSRLAGFR